VVSTGNWRFFAVFRCCAQVSLRQIGNKPGTGGSTGVAYLQSTLNKRFFPELWEVRSQL